MLGKTHIAGGICLAATLTAVSGIYNPVINANNLSNIEALSVWSLYLVGAANGAILPDIDKKGSTISNKNRLVSFIIRLIFTHRGFTHSLLCMILAASLLSPLAFFNIFTQALWVGIITGYGSHLLLDALNPTGIPFLYPYKTKISFAKIKTGGFIEGFVFIGCVIVIYVLCKPIIANTYSLINISEYIPDKIGTFFAEITK